MLIVPHLNVSFITVIFIESYILWITLRCSAESFDFASVWRNPIELLESYCLCLSLVSPVEIAVSSGEKSGLARRKFEE